MPNYELAGEAGWVPSAWARSHTVVPLQLRAGSAGVGVDRVA